MSVKDVRTKLPIKKILTVIDEPTFLALKEMREALSVNEAAIPITQGGGLNGNLGLIMDTEFYNNLSGTPYTVPT